MSNITKVSLLNVPLEADYKHTLWFENADAQFDYFDSRCVYGLKFEDYSYQRKDHIIRVKKSYDQLAGRVNYVMYQNKEVSDKWYYAFITKLEYVNSSVTNIHIQTDVMQTWLEECELKSCFVEREHVEYDRIGENTVPEGLETGEFICNNMIQNKSTDDTCFIVASSVNLLNGADSGVRIYNAVLTGWYYYCFESKEEVEKVLKDISTLRTNDAIVSMFIMPRNYVNNVHPYDDKHYYGYQVIEDGEEVYAPKKTFWDKEKDEGSDPILKPKTVNGYIPKNNKLLAYPYSYLLMDNNSGATAVYKYELFDTSIDKDGKECCRFVIYGCITPGGALRLIPLKYNGLDGENHQYGLNGGKYPICGWQSDYYTNWMTQNGLNLEVQREALDIAYDQTLANATADVISEGLTGATKAVTFQFGDAVNSLGNLIQQNVNVGYTHKDYNNKVKGMVAQRQMHAFQSPTVSGSTNSGDINYTMGNTRFTAYQMSVKKEYAEIIDSYLSAYGYQTNRVKIPNSNHTKLYWYTKTVGCEIDGAIPNEDIQIIKACYDNGITFWRNGEDIGRYTEIIDGEEVLRDNLYGH